MTRLQTTLSQFSIESDWDGDDVRTIQNFVPPLMFVPMIDVARLWSKYSEEACATWLNPDADELSNFKEWMNRSGRE